MSDVRIIPIRVVPEVREGDDLAQLLLDHFAPAALEHNDVVVIAQKVVSKAEGRFVPLEQHRRAALAESRRVLRRTGDMIIAETHHGFVCANAGVDASNVPGERALLLPLDADLSARRIRARFQQVTGVTVGVIISDTFGRAWRVGQTNVAIGVAGIDPFIDYRGRADTTGRQLTATRIAIADELAGAAELVMGKTRRVCAALIRGSRARPGAGAAIALVRHHGDDMFR